YFIGNDPQKWHSNIPTYAKVEYQDIYPGVDMTYNGNQRQLKYDLLVHPGTDPEIIKLAFQGADSLEIDSQGDLVLHTVFGEVRQNKPLIYQDVDGVKQIVAGNYELKDKHEIGFHVAAYNANKPLVIDPVLSYSTCLGGSGTDSNGIAMDSEGNIY